MEMSIQLTDRVGDIVKGYPKSISVLRKYSVIFLTSPKLRKRYDEGIKQTR
ncbi:hypothetical protein HQN89_33785 [Paenibacillus frigoriresistens]|uniref:hypothetical protein n=1 Tax=Paenibacillus alginolyticus TaxID=59839 RepID=UPI00156545F2|nr:hypothetical protein [Paenibacillus frigoriresistens]NRF95799.1 hypothetical protein [Paenibacillus frigoriresistens]